MSTRSIIVVTGNNQYDTKATVRLYKHSDGYPTDNLRIIALALAKAIEMNMSPKKLKVDSVVGKIIGEATDSYGMGAKIESRSNSRLTSEDFGNHSDLEWIYVVDVDELSVNVYGGGFTGNAPQFAVRAGTIDPRDYIKQLIADCRERELGLIEASIAKIEELGFAINYPSVSV